MKIEHVGLWVRDLELMKTFYEKYFGAKANKLYHNKNTGFTSYFLTFDSGDTRLELMNKAGLEEVNNEVFGYGHIAYQVEDEEAVDCLHKQLVHDGYPHVNGPRTTGDGYYEAVIKDPEGNIVEIMG